jgi:hypothetical protein
MSRIKPSISPSVDVIEPRVLPSTAAPLLSSHELSGVVRDVRAILTTLARTTDTAQASAQLTRLSSRLPSGPQALAPSWQSDLGLYHPHSAGSFITTQKRILADLHRYALGGNPPVTGSGSTTAATPGHGNRGTPPPVPAPSLDSVRIENTTGLALTVTVHLRVPQVQQPYIIETIPAGGTSNATFDFGTATDAFMTMDVSLANGSQSPPPFSNLSLAQPMSGYNGTIFTIVLVGPYFNVTPL